LVFGFMHVNEVNQACASNIMEHVKMSQV